jgi:DNA-binding NarL/FixJ family response regulator
MKRPRTRTRLSKLEPAYWRGRLYKNIFAYQGRRVEVRSWSVKIQRHGKRRAFTLSSPNRTQAANEACQIYQTIHEYGRDAVPARDRRSLDSEGLRASIQYDAEYWKHRLIHRTYPESVEPPGKREFAVRIEHGRISHYFPLGTKTERQAAAQAVRIHRTIVNKGWAEANKMFPRELALSLRWQDNPLAWTYTTFHTRLEKATAKPNPDARKRLSKRRVIFIEPDVGIRFALAACANSQEGFRCEATFARGGEALRAIPHLKVDLILANHDLPGEVGAGFFEELHRNFPGLVVLSYSIYADSDELFKSTPGGAVVYLLKRTPPDRVFEPIAGLEGAVTSEQVASHVRKYFQQMAAMLPSGPPFWKLAKLTPREQEILALLSKGAVIKEIAGTLGISNWTVHGHVKSIFEKLKVHTRTEAVVRYLQR